MSDWIYVERKDVPESVFRELTIFVPEKDDNGNDTTIEYPVFDTVSQGRIISIPRYCRFSRYLLEKNQVENNTTEGEIVSFEMVVGPRDSHQERAIRSMVANTHGILCAKTAFGKTFVAISAIQRIGRRALIIMHKRDLMEQWKNDILKYTNLNENDVQIFTGSEDNFARGKPITITSVQNLNAKMRRGDWRMRDVFQEENFGIAIYDECHTTMCPAHNGKTSHFVFSERIYGLSATPRRGDEFDKVIDWTFGDIIFNDSRKMLPVYVCFSPFSLEIPYGHKKYFKMAETQYTLRYNKWLAKQELFIDNMASIIVGLIKQNRKILAVGALKSLLETVYKEVERRLVQEKIDTDKIRLIHGTSESSFSEVKSFSKKEVDNFSCIFSTNKFFSEGLSIEWLDTIVYLTPPSSKSLSAIPQLVGRIVREYEGKEYVIVIDTFNDQFDIETARQKKRVEAYKNLGYDVMRKTLRELQAEKHSLFGGMIS